MKSLNRRLADIKKRYPSDIIPREHEWMAEKIATSEKDEQILKITFRGKLLALVAFQKVNDTCVLKKYMLSTPFKDTELAPVFGYMFHQSLSGYKRYVVDQDFEGTLPKQVQKGSTIPLSSLFEASPHYLHSRNQYVIPEQPLPENVLNDNDKIFLTAADHVDERNMVFHLADNQLIDRVNVNFERHSSPKDLIFRRARQEDFIKIDHLHREGMNEKLVGVSERDRRKLYPDLWDVEGNYNRNHGVFIVAEYRGKIIGMGACRKMDSTCAELTRFSVAKPYQGLGLGSIILSLVLHLAMEEGYSKFFLRTSERQSAAHFYNRKEGFIEEGERIEIPEMNRLFKKCGLLRPGEGVKFISMKKKAGIADVLRYLADHDLLSQHPKISSFQFGVDRMPWTNLEKNGIRQPTKEEIERFQERRAAQTNALIERLLENGRGSLAKAYEQEKRQRWRQTIAKQRRRDSRKRPSGWAKRRKSLQPTEKQRNQLELFGFQSARKPNEIDKYKHILERPNKER